MVSNFFLWWFSINWFSMVFPPKNPTNLRDVQATQKALVPLHKPPTAARHVPPGHDGLRTSQKVVSHLPTSPWPRFWQEFPEIPQENPVQICSNCLSFGWKKKNTCWQKSWRKKRSLCYLRDLVVDAKSLRCSSFCCWMKKETLPWKHCLGLWISSLVSKVVKWKLSACQEEETGLALFPSRCLSQSVWLL